MSSIREVYNNIATHFSQTRYRQWTCVKEFLNDLPKNSLIADIGCGNGKNMIHPHHEFIGCDLTENLLEIAQQTQKDVFQASATHIPFRTNSVNHSICIAVLHHLPSHCERMKLLRELLRITEPGGKLLVTVWALEQPLKPRWKQLTEDGDFIIPWQDQQGNTFERFYHFFSEYEINSVITELVQENLCAEYSVKTECYNYCLTLQKTPR